MSIVLPYSRESEDVVLGSIFLMPEAIIRICDLVAPEDFYVERNRQVYKAMLELFRRGEPIDALTVKTELCRAGRDDLIVGDLLDATPTATHVVYHAQQVRHLAICRRGMMLASEASQRFYERPQNVQEAVGELVNKFLALADKVDRRNPDPIDILARLRQVDYHRGIKLASKAMQALTGGLVPGELWVIGAFSSTGKTAFALQLAREALEQGKAVAYFSLEMSQEQLMLRLLANLSGVPIWMIAYRVLDFDQHRAVAEAEDYVGSCSGRFWIYDDVYETAEVSYLARKHKVQAGLDVLFLDYIQNVSDEGTKRHDVIHGAVNSLLRLAKQLDCCVVVLSQISNAEAKDRMGDNDAYTFKESGSLRDTADKAWMLTRDREAEAREPVGCLHAHLKKNRQGKIGDVDFNFEFATGRIWEKVDGKH